LFTPQAAATLGLMLPADKRAAAVAFIFIGWSIASVAGMPAGSLIAAFAGWRIAYALMAVLALISALLVWRTLPKGLNVPTLSLSAWRAVFFDPVLILILLVTLASGSGQFTLSGYLVVIYKDVLGASPGLIALLLSGFGVAGVAGNFLAARFVGKLGVETMIVFALGAILLGLAVFWSSFGLLAGAAVSVALWGLGTFSSNSLQQSRLITHEPALASASVALNTSTIYLGQAIGAATGAKLIAGKAFIALAPVAACFLILAIALTLLADRFSRRRIRAQK
ncbi:MAG TPA: MFS transporter, partial [Nordella sp.]|nr:MFS transporter [Nordella sp.]